MAPARSASPRGRLFVALELPETVRAAIAGWQREALVDPALRPVRPEGLHITLAFLGWRAESDFERIGEAALGIGAAKGPRMELVRELVPLPRGRPRLLAVEVHSPEAVELQEKVEGRLIEAGVHQPEERPFWPHVTVARVRAERPGSRRPARLAEPLPPLPEGCERPFDAVRLRLYRSFLRPSGAEYVPVSTLDLDN